MNLHDMQLQAAYVRGADGEFHLRAEASKEKKLLTHYDLLVSKTPEEMAEFLASQSRIGEAWWLNWLMQEAE